VVTPVPVVVIVGTRPEAIKLSPVLTALARRPAVFEPMICSTGQQRDLVAPALAEFGFTAAVDLDVMRDNDSLARLTARLLPAIDDVLTRHRPAWVIVQGDTTSAMTGALAAFYRGIPVAHVEAGLRTDDRRAPFPEEVNRRIITQCADLHFAPTSRCGERLAHEGVARSAIYVTGNTVVDALLWMRERIARDGTTLAPPIAARIADQRLILVTLHRRENWGAPMARICAALLTIVDALPDTVVAFPVHPNPRVRAAVERALDHPRICLLEPQSYASVVELMDRAFLVLTDSGGIQEEAPTFGTPVLVLRDRTERPEGIEEGVACLVGTESDRIHREVLRLALDPAAYARMSSARSPYGDGRSSARIRTALLEQLGRATGPAADAVPRGVASLEEAR
jgi:UDP-N-acetylglucosamine 2-epimerase